MKGSADKYLEAFKVFKNKSLNEIKNDKTQIKELTIFKYNIQKQQFYLKIFRRFIFLKIRMKISYMAC